jgi:hypothetical protein
LIKSAVEDLIGHLVKDKSEMKESKTKAKEKETERNA